MNILEEIGLTKREAQVYEILLKIGESPISTVVKEMKSHPQVVYRVIDSLIDKKLVVAVRRKNRKYVQAASPKKLEKIEEKRLEMLQKAIPDLLALQRPGKETLVSVTKGDEAIRAIRGRGIDELEAGGTHYILGASGDRFYEVVDEKYYREIEQKRIKKKIRKKRIAFESQRKSIEKDRYRELVEDRFLQEDFATPSSANIFGGLVAILIWAEDPIAIVIESPEVAESYRSYFDSMWRMAKS